MLPANALHSRTWFYCPAVWIALVAAIPISFVGMLVGQEWLASRKWHACLREFREQGVIADNVAIEERIRAVTSPENSLEWLKLSGYFNSPILIEYPQTSRFPYFGGEATPASALSGDSWPIRSEILDFLAHVRPLIDRIHEVADRTKQPIWHPLNFQDGTTHLGPSYESVNVFRILSLDFDDALFARDRERAVRDLQSMRAGVDAFHSGMFNRSEHYYFERLNFLDESIFRGMQSALWDPDDLAQMRVLVGAKRDRFESWASHQEMGIAATLELLESGQYSRVNRASGGIADLYTEGIHKWIFELPSVRLRYLEDALRLKNIADREFRALADPTNESKYRRNYGMIANWSMELVNVFFRAEDQRRIALTALAIKQYQMGQGTFPKSLQELLDDPTLQVPENVLYGVDGLPWGYQRSDEVAWIWNVRAAGTLDPSIMVERPEFNPDTGLVENKQGRVVSIRSPNPRSTSTRP